MADDNPFGVLVEGAKETRAALAEMDKRVNAATLAALKKSQRLARTSIRSGMRGRPRWDRRGRIGRNGSVFAVNLNLNPHHVVKGGGPGSFTGVLSRAVGGMKRPKKTPEGYSGGVGVGGPKSISQMYRSVTEARYPYMKPGVAKAEPKIAPVWEAAWRKATEIEAGGK